MRRASKREERAALYRTWASSGQSGAEFCREQGIEYWVLREAIPQERDPKRRIGKSEFQELPPVPIQEADYSVTLRNGRELRIPSQFNESQVRALIGVLESC